MQVILLLERIPSILDLPLLSPCSNSNLEGDLQMVSRSACAPALQMAIQAALQAGPAAPAAGTLCDNFGHREVPRPHRW